jgi:hypothetical protein
MGEGAPGDRIHTCRAARVTATCSMRRCSGVLGEWRAHASGTSLRDGRALTHRSAEDERSSVAILARSADAARRSVQELKRRAFLLLD